MRILVSTFLVGVCLAAQPALAQQHPWVASCVYAGNCGLSSSDVPARSYGRVHSGHRWHTGKSSQL
jgi:hypothetical protein